MANVGAEYKFDDNVYQKIQDLILEEPQPGDYGVHDGERYYNVIMVVSRDDNLRRREYPGRHVDRYDNGNHTVAVPVDRALMPIL